MNTKPDIEGATECPWCKDITLVTKINGEGQCECGHFTGVPTCEQDGNSTEARGSTT